MENYKDKSKRDVILLISVFFILVLINYPFLDRAVENFLGSSQTNIVVVERVIDGDTVVSNGTSIRLLGIDAPERREFYFEESKSFLEELILNKSVRLEFVGPKQDKYYRTLAYIHFEGENVNVKMVEEGFANYYFYDGRDKYSGDLEDAWSVCIEKEINLCERSKNVCASCIGIHSKNSIINNCGFSCDINNWEIEGEGRNKVVFEKMLNPGERLWFELDLSYSGGSLFLRDSEGKLVDWDVYA